MIKIGNFDRSCIHVVFNREFDSSRARESGMVCTICSNKLFPCFQNWESEISHAEKGLKSGEYSEKGDDLPPVRGSGASICTSKVMF